MLFRIIYFSKETQPLDGSGITELLEQSRERNGQLGITGMLLYIKGTFLQVLEGPEDGVQAVYQSILEDTRHQEINLLVNEPMDARDFPDWTMGFESVDLESGLHAESATNFLKTLWDDVDPDTYPEKTRLFLKAFREIAP